MPESTPEGKKPEEASAKNNDSNPEPVFTYEDVRGIVRDFTLAWIEGRVTISFTTAEMIMENEKSKGNTISFADASRHEMDAKNAFENLVAICSGEKESTPKEYRETVYQLFRWIISYREGERVEGSFAGESIREKVDRLESRLSATNNLVEQLVRWLRDELGV